MQLALCSSPRLTREHTGASRREADEGPTQRKLSRPAGEQENGRPTKTHTHTHTNTHTHTHTHTHFQVQGLEKGVSENEAPGPVGAYTTTHNDTITLMPNLIHRISFGEIRMSHACCRGYIGRQEHPETQSNTRTYGTKKSSYVHAYIGRDGKWRKRVQT